MTRDQFKSLAPEQVVKIVWDLAEAHGELAAIIRGLDPAGSPGQLGRNDRQRFEEGRRSVYLRYGSLSKEGAVWVASELVSLHPQGVEIHKLLVTRLDEQVNRVIDSMLADLEQLSAVA